MLRTYAKYLRQAGFPYSQSHIESVINGNAGTARSLVELFEALFDPEAPRTRHGAVTRRQLPLPWQQTSTHWSASTRIACCGRWRR